MNSARKFIESLINGLIGPTDPFVDTVVVETRSTRKSTGSEAAAIHQAEANGNQQPQLPSGNFNSGLGAGAHNSGKGAAGINSNKGNITYRLNTKGSEKEVPKGKNINIGLGAGGINSGDGAAGLNNNNGTIVIE